MRIRSYTYEAGLNAFYYNTKASADKRGYVFNLSLDKASHLSQLPCTYCGKHPSKPHRKCESFLYNGLDRVDNNVGYIESNVVPCCFICNKMKGVLSKEEFMEHLDKIWTRVG